MKPINKMTTNEIRIQGLNALKKELGATGLVKFMQQFDLGDGDYTNDRQKWQKKYKVQTLAKKIRATTKTKD